MPARPKKPLKSYHHGDLRNALLKAAREVLEERGPSFLGLREISRRVGVSAPSAYHGRLCMVSGCYSLMAKSCRGKTVKT
jgi:hypothetical protein